MALLEFCYTMDLSFSRDIDRHHFTLRCLPADDGFQQVLDLQAMVLPEGKLSRGEDSFGNACLYGSRMEPHDQFSLYLSGKAETGLGNNPVDEPRFLTIYTLPTKLTGPGPALTDLYQALPPYTGGSVRERALARMEQVSTFLSYVPGVTSADTAAEEAAALRQGVCQDYAHILLALLRLDRIPCRYVCGMMVGEGASHAWAEVAGDQYWLGLDPTNRCCTDENYLVFSRGRDARDCTINRGVYCGAAAQNTKISVRVIRTEEE